VEVCQSILLLFNLFNKIYLINIFHNIIIEVISTPSAQVLIKPIERIAPSSPDVNKCAVPGFGTEDPPDITPQSFHPTVFRNVTDRSVSAAFFPVTLL
jgi:hypothetical protein